MICPEQGESRYSALYGAFGFQFLENFRNQLPFGRNSRVGKNVRSHRHGVKAIILLFFHDARNILIY
jgi:hypothetical protein